MCNPVLITTAATVVSTVSQGYQAKKQGKQADQVAKYNAQLQENEATQVRNKGVEEENAVREKNAQILARQRAELGAANVNMMTGSALDIQESSTLIGEVDALRVRGNFDRQATALEQQAEFTRAQGASAKKAGKTAFNLSLLTSVGQIAGSGVADKWFKPTSSGKMASFGSEGMPTIKGTNPVFGGG
jgi:hypothetical protein